MAQSSNRGPRVLCVFVPGIKGSELYCNVCERRAWPPAFIDNIFSLAKRVISNRSISIEHIMEDSEMECLATHDKTATNVLHSVSVINGILKKEVYGPFVDKLNADIKFLQDEYYAGEGPSIDLLEYAYDWTLSNSSNAYGIYTNVFEKEIARGYYDEFIIISHSMGGLIVRHLLEYIIRYKKHNLPGSPDTCDKFINSLRLFYGIGVPHYGCVRSLHYLVDSNYSTHSRYCRNMQSLYDMVPFNDLDKQISPYQNELPDNMLKRTRSDIFLKSVITSREIQNTDGNRLKGLISERDILIDPNYWETNNRDRSKQCSSHEYIDSIINSMIVRFPMLSDKKDMLRNGILFHCSLNSNNKPDSCRYLFVNAFGVATPSSIGADNSLLRECKSGDGVVCSNVSSAKDESTMSRLGRIIRSNLRKRKSFINKQTIKKNIFDDSRNNNNNEIIDLANKDSTKITTKTYNEDIFNNVHVTMLTHIDVFKVLRDLYLTSNPLFYRHNVWKDMIGVESGTEISLDKSASHAFKNFIVKIDNLNNGKCVISVNQKPVIDGHYQDKYKSNDSNIIATSLVLRLKIFSGSNDNNNSNDTVNMCVRTRPDGSIMDNLQIMLANHYELVNMALLDENILVN